MRRNPLFFCKIKPLAGDIHALVVTGTESNTDLILKMGRLQSLRSFDAFPRAEEHLLKKTHSGAVGM